MNEVELVSEVKTISDRCFTAKVWPDFNLICLYRDDVCVGIFNRAEFYGFASNCSIACVRAILPKAEVVSDLEKQGVAEVIQMEPDRANIA